VLGSGNFATVYKATMRKTGIVYAVKEVKKNEAFNAKVEASLEREIGILMSIDHVSIVTFSNIFFIRSDYRCALTIEARPVC
jgi:serine/threonine protein kinase